MKRLKYLLLAIPLFAIASWEMDFDEDFASASQAFSPLSLSPSMWLDASDASTITTTGASVTNWVDKSGSGNHASLIGMSTTWPTFSNAVQNGKSCIYFDGGDYLKTPFLSATNTTVILVMRRISGTVFIGARDSVNTRSYFANSATNTLRALVGSDIDVNSTTSWTTNFMCTGFAYDGTTVSIRNKGSEVYTKAQSGSGANFTQGYHIGTYNNIGTPATPDAVCFIGEILCWRRTLTAGELSKVESYLITKWSIQ